MHGTRGDSRLLRLYSLKLVLRDVNPKCQGETDGPLRGKWVGKGFLHELVPNDFREETLAG